MNEFFDIAVSLATLTVLEIVLGIDNLVFLAIISQKLPKAQQPFARKFGLILALVTRLLLLASALALTKLTHPIIGVGEFNFSIRDLFLLLGGCFLLAKSTQEIHVELEPAPPSPKKSHSSPLKQTSQFSWIVIQIAVLDIIFSLDSVLTAIGLTNRFWLMATAIIIAIILMICASEPLSRFIEKFPTLKMLALCFLILIGTLLVADAFHFHIPRGYIYFAMAFSISIEFLNILRRRQSRD